FTISIFFVHVVVGVVLVVPFLVFGFSHLVTAWARKNRVAVRLGIVLFVVSIVVGVTGLALIQLSGLPQLPTGTSAREVTYWLHLLVPLAAVVLYVLPRRAGPDIKWRWGGAWGVVVAVVVLAMCAMHFFDPRESRQGSVEGEKYFRPSDIH